MAPFLWRAITFATFNLSGKIPFTNDSFIKIASAGEIE